MSSFKLKSFLKFILTLLGIHPITTLIAETINPQQSKGTLIAETTSHQRPEGIEKIQKQTGCGPLIHIMKDDPVKIRSPGHK